ncbi:thermonuclease family protein [Loktanella salsilacus]|uniref:thermonuclease family protein n=1 Tax=Loktanella salsilacus TaxID=195913 RepID=UPI00158731C1
MSAARSRGTNFRVFDLCHRRRHHRRKGDRFRLVGFDTPETYRPQCDYELALGRAATSRLRDLLRDAQRVDLVVLPGRDRYDRGLARLIVQQLDVADTLVSEGLARRYNGGKRLGWCQ